MSKNLKRIVVKIGSLGVTEELGGVSEKKIHRLLHDLYRLKEAGHEIILVSSGAINTGRSFVKRPEEKKMMISYQQACAAIGQPILMNAYQKILSMWSWPSAQLLVTHEDFKDRTRFLNIRNTIMRLLENGILPIINENDTVSFAEITVGDNDQLAVMVTEAVDADGLILLTEADGLYDKNPKEEDAKRFDIVHFSDDFSGIKIAAKTSVGRGGMDTKLRAVRKLTPLGVDVVIGTFLQDNPISRLLAKGGGSLFLGNPETQVNRRQSWLSTVVKNEAVINIDEGAAEALLKKKTSLLPVGVRKVSGTFKRGDVVNVKLKNKIIAVGICEFSSKELELIKGKKSSDIAITIEDAPSNVAIHKDNLLLV
jgi:glutamate 5-kinase